MYVIQSETRDGGYLFWSNSMGWVDLPSADVWADRKGSLPVGDSVEWVKLPTKPTLCAARPAS